MITQNYQHILVLAYAAEEINGNPYILSNITLGFRIYNNYFSARFTHLAAIDLFSTWSKLIPNYKCGIKNTPIAVIGGPTSDTDLHMSTILSNYKVPQVRCMYRTLSLRRKEALPRYDLVAYSMRVT